MNRQLIRRLPIALAGLAVLLFMAMTAVGATPTSITLTLQAGVDQTKTPCHQSNHYQAYKLGTRIYMDGYVTPAPDFPDGGWKVKIKVKKCVLGVFKTVKQVHVLGNGVTVNGVKEGHYKWSWKPAYTGFYFARAYYYTSTTTSIQSTDEHFHVQKLAP